MKKRPCLSPGCSKPAQKGNYCFACAKRRYRENNRLKACYYTLRDNAKRRGKIFDLTYEQYVAFAVETDYFFKKGCSKKSLHIDRIDETGPYSIENIQVLENSANVRKYLQFKARIKNVVEFEVITDKPINIENFPF